MQSGQKVRKVRSTVVHSITSASHQAVAMAALCAAGLFAASEVLATVGDKPFEVLLLGLHAALGVVALPFGWGAGAPSAGRAPVAIVYMVAAGAAMASHARNTASVLVEAAVVASRPGLGAALAQAGADVASAATGGLNACQESIAMDVVRALDVLSVLIQKPRLVMVCVVVNEMVGAVGVLRGGPRNLLLPLGRRGSRLERWPAAARRGQAARARHRHPARCRCTRSHPFGSVAWLRSVQYRADV
jgi:hypothetical protein